jgi:hypothetical protein
VSVTVLSNRRSFLLVSCAGVGSALLPRIGNTAQVGNVRFDDVLNASGVRLKLQGAGVYYYKRLLKAVAAALYLDDQASAGDPLADVAKRLEMEYFWGVSGKSLVAGSTAMLARNLPPAKLAALQPQIDTMHTLYRDVAAGDRCALVYLPDVGTSLFHNGKLLGTVSGTEFASAYFSIWFGEQPMDAGLKRQLLGR